MDDELNSKIDFSVVIPTFNYPHLLGRRLLPYVSVGPVAGCDQENKCLKY